jgi:hypothetical protein
MLNIRKIWKGTYLVDGEYLTQDYNQAVIIANTGRKIKSFEIYYRELSFKNYLKFKIKWVFKVLWYCINRPFDILMEWM